MDPVETLLFYARKIQDTRNDLLFGTDDIDEENDELEITKQPAVSYFILALADLESAAHHLKLTAHWMKEKE